MKERESVFDLLSVLWIIILIISFGFILIYWIVISIINIIIMVINLFIKKNIRYIKYINSNKRIYKFNRTNKSSTSNVDKLEKEMDNYSLNEEEKKLVRKKENSIYDFSEDDDLEDDDYYGEDEK